MSAGTLGACIYFIPVGWTVCSKPTYVSCNAWSTHDNIWAQVLFATQRYYLGWDWLTCYMRAYIWKYTWSDKYWLKHVVAEWAGKEEGFHGRVFLGFNSFELKSMLVCIAFQEGSLCRYCRGLHLSRSFLSSQCLGLSNFPFLQKEGIPIGKPCTQMQMMHLSAGWEDTVEGFL